MTKGGAETPQSPQVPVGVDPGQRPTFLQGVDFGSADEQHVAYLAHPILQELEQATRRQIEEMGLPSTLIESGPSKAESLFAAMQESLARLRVTKSFLNFEIGNSGVVGSYSKPVYCLTSRQRHLRVVVTYFSKEDPSKELLEKSYRSLRVAKSAAKRMVKSDILYLNYQFKPAMPARRIQFTCTVGAPVNHSFDALCTRLGVEPKVMQQLANQEGINHASD